MNDMFARYVQGLKLLQTHLEKQDTNQSVLKDVDLLQCRLENAISAALRHGDGPRVNEIINEILDQIVKFSRDNTGKSFNHWCDAGQIAHAFPEHWLTKENEPAPNKPPFIQSQTSKQTAESSPFLPLPIQAYILEMFELLQKAQPLFEQDRTIYPFDLAPIRLQLQQNNRGISHEVIASIEPVTPTHTALVVAVNHVKHCTEEIIELLSKFEAACQKPTSKKQRQSIQEKLDTIISYMQRYPDLISK
jgi:hypothetical protein